MKRTQVVIAINLEEYISSRTEALDAADYMAAKIKQLTGLKAYAIDADIVEVESD